MALSGSVVTNDYSGRYYTVTWTATQSVANNTSTISWVLSCDGGSSNWYAERTLEVSIAGNTVYSKSSRVERYTGTIASGTTTIAHNSNGAASFDISIQAAVYLSSVNLTGDGTFTLNTIARSSSITLASDTILGEACCIKWTPNSASFQFKLKFAIGSWSYITDYISPNTTSSYTYSDYVIPIDVAETIPDSPSGTMTAYLYTYNGTAQIGTTDSATFTITAPADLLPTLNSFAVDLDNSANAIAQEWGVYIAGISKATLSATASGICGSSVSSFLLSDSYNATVTGSSLDYTGGTLASGSRTFTVSARDSRGRNSESQSETVFVYSYSTPSIDTFSIDRSSENATLIKLNACWTYSSVNSFNQSSAILKYKKTSEDAWTTYSGEITNNEPTLLDETFLEESGYDFMLIVTDSLGNTASSVVKISTLSVLLNFRAGGGGLGVGKIAESDSLEVALPSKFTNSISVSSDSDDVNLEVNVPSKFTGDVSIDGDSDTTCFEVTVPANFTGGLYSNGAAVATSLPEIQSGMAVIAPLSANSITSVSITFPKEFSSTPNVVATAESAVPGTTVTEVSVGDITTTGCSLRMYRTTATATNIFWIAMC